MTSKYFPLHKSLWAATAVEAPATVPLDNDLETDIAIVGAGFCGLSTALHLAERGLNVTILEAEEIGFGGSGRNGGQVIPGLKYDPSELREKLGRDRGERLAEFSATTADTVFSLIAKHQLRVPHVRKGWVQGAHNSEALHAVQRRVKDWSELGVDAELLDKAGVARILGSDRYLGGWVDPRGGGIQPLSYARELGRVALAHGAKIYTRSPAIELMRVKDRWRVKTANGPSITCTKVLIASNGYTGDLWPDLKKTIISANSFIVATQPLPHDVKASILPQGHVSSDGRNLLLYYRIDHTGRLLMGGRGSFSEPNDPAQWLHLEGAVKKIFPQAKDCPIEFRWCGHVAVTRDFMPHIHQPAPGLLIDIGCQGRGVGLQSRMGIALAECLATDRTDALPVPPSPIEKLPFFGLRRLYLAAVIAWYKMRDGGV